jgi:hypothetical protein
MILQFVELVVWKGENECCSSSLGGANVKVEAL